MILQCECQAVRIWEQLFGEVKSWRYLKQKNYPTSASSGVRGDGREGCSWGNDTLLWQLEKFEYQYADGVLGVAAMMCTTVRCTLKKFRMKSEHMTQKNQTLRKLTRITAFHTSEYESIPEQKHSMRFHLGGLFLFSCKYLLCDFVKLSVWYANRTQI